MDSLTHAIGIVMDFCFVPTASCVVICMIEARRTKSEEHELLHATDLTQMALEQTDRRRARQKAYRITRWCLLAGNVVYGIVQHCF